MTRVASTTGLLLLAFALLASASEPVLRSDELLAHQDAIRAELETGSGRYQDLPEARRKAALADQRRLAALMQGKADTSQLGRRERDQVFNLVASIEAALAAEDEEQPVCTREARTGSNYLVRVCRSKAQIREQQASGQNLLKDETGRLKCTEGSGCM